MACSKPFKLLQLPSLTHDVIFSLMDIGDVYHLSKCSTRSRYAVKKSTHRQTYFFSIAAGVYDYCLRISSDCGKKFSHQLRPLRTSEPVCRPTYRNSFWLMTYWKEHWAAAKEEIVYLLDVFTRKVNTLDFHDTKKVIETTEFLKTVTHSSVESVYSGDNETVIDDEVYKYVLKEFKNAKELKIRGSPSTEFQFDEMEPFTGDLICISPADWVTVDHLIRCFLNVEKVELRISRNRSQIIPALMHQFFTAWQKESRIKDLELGRDWTFIDFQVMLENVPKTVVKRVEVESVKRAFQEGQCFLIRQESGMEAIAYHVYDTLYFKTNFRLLSDDE